MSTEKAGVYAIVHRSTGRAYVGSTANISKRWSQHRQQLRDGIHRNAHLQAAWNKYGETAFGWQILEICQPENRIKREQHFIDTMKATDPRRGFNKATTAGVSYGGTARTWTDDQRAQASQYWKQRRPQGWLPPVTAGTYDPTTTCPKGHTKDGSYTKTRKNGSVKVTCQECERKAALERSRKSRGVPLDYPKGKHFRRR